MKNWKTTLAGLATGLPLLIDTLLTAYTMGQFDEKNTYKVAASIAIIVLGWILKDPKKWSKK